jgi:hypothetical protein
MKRTQFLAHLSFPVLVALIGLLLSLRREPLTSELVLSHLAWAFLFYAAPHFLWAAIAAAVKPVAWAWHAGFGVASTALVLVGALSVWGPKDQSGLPYQWLAYWPLAGLMLVVVILSWFLAGRPRAETPNPSFKRARLRRSA